MSTGSDATLSAAADYYLRQLRDGDFESAFYGLIELQPAVVALLIAAHNAETSPAIRSDLLRIIWEFRTPLALPSLRGVLDDRRDNRWKSALDGLVTLASAEAVQTLESALRAESTLPNPDSEYIDWLHEALEQAQQSHDANSNADGIA